MTNGAFDLSSLQQPLTDEQEARLREMSDAAQGETLQALTGFLIVQSTDGTWAVLPDPTTEVEVQRPPTSDDIFSGCAVVQKDIVARESAVHTQHAMMQLGAAMQHKMQTENIASQLGNLRG